MLAAPSMGPTHLAKSNGSAERTTAKRVLGARQRWQERPDPSKLYMHDQRSMSHAEITPDPNELAFTPHLEAGDLLLQCGVLGREGSLSRRPRTSEAHGSRAVGSVTCANERGSWKDEWPRVRLSHVTP